MQAEVDANMSRADALERLTASTRCKTNRRPNGLGAFLWVFCLLHHAYRQHWGVRVGEANTTGVTAAHRRPERLVRVQAAYHDREVEREKKLIQRSAGAKRSSTLHPGSGEHQTVV